MPDLTFSRNNIVQDLYLIDEEIDSFIDKLRIREIQSQVEYTAGLINVEKLFNVFYLELPQNLKNRFGTYPNINIGLLQTTYFEIKEQICDKFNISMAIDPEWRDLAGYIYN